MAKKQPKKNGWGGARKGSGPKPKANARRGQIAIRLTDEEREFLEGLARHEEMTVAQYCRERLLHPIEEE